MSKPRIMTVVGARPQFVKAAVVSHEIERRGSLDELLIHTGQHFDYGMSQAFFDELSIPEPYANLGISGGSHAEMTARMLVALEEQMTELEPELLLLYGDTNSTLAGALAAAKLHIPITHVEAGARTRSATNPEEINRICCDHISTVLLPCTEDSLENLVREGLGEKSAVVGDPMYDAFLAYREIAQKPTLVRIDDNSPCDVPSEFIYLTCHREENTSDLSALRGILDAASELGQTVYPVHPRNKAQIIDSGLVGEYPSVSFCNPVGYLESIWLVSNAMQVVTDSGGLQREAFFAGVKCTTVLPFEVWPETMVGNRNMLAQPTKESILSAFSARQMIDGTYLPFGDGRASARIVDALERYLEG